MNKDNNINIQGHSGCLLEFIGENSIRKSTKDSKYYQRLEKQASKQKFFVSDLLFLKVPKVIDEKKGEQSYSFDMEYIFSKDVFSFLESTDIQNIDVFIKNIIMIIEEEIISSQYETVSKTLIINKFNSIQENMDNEIIHRFKGILESIEHILLNFDSEIKIPIGICHGDLTLSNILIVNNNIYLIDFLDTFIETPLQDIVKIRQDTKHLWSLNLLTNKIDLTKIKIILEYIDNKIENHFKDFKFFKYYDVFQIINLLRIVPYAQNDNILNYLYKELEQILKEKKLKCQQY